MPSFGHLSDAGFVRDAWGKQAGQHESQAITPDTVAGQRKRDMTPAEVHAYREATK